MNNYKVGDKILLIAEITSIENNSFYRCGLTGRYTYDCFDDEIYDKAPEYKNGQVVEFQQNSHNDKWRIGKIIGKTSDNNYIVEYENGEIIKTNSVKHFYRTIDIDNVEFKLVPINN